MLTLNFNCNFEALNSLSGLTKLDESFLQYLKEQDISLANSLKSYRKQLVPQDKEYSTFLVKLAPLLDDFISELFNITQENLVIKKIHKQFDVIYECRRKFIQRYVLKKYPKDMILDFDFMQISLELADIVGTITEHSISNAVLNWQESPEEHSKQLDLVAKYCAFMVHNNSNLMLFDVPMPMEQIRKHKIASLKQDLNLGFDYRDREKSVDKAVAHSKYCIYCHKQEKDSCSHGITDTDKNGCPLQQKISEMHLLKSQGLNIAALGVIMIDNPLVAATGHRICNDCMQSCIYQKQDPVNTPMVESNILEEVLSLPWGVEIYLLLSKWNPLNIESPLPKSLTNKNILVTGLGPAGFALSHYLINEGHNVSAIDGLKISPLECDTSKPIKYWQDIKIPLSQKKPQGFGGVAEYGITNRWDKNNLTLIRLILERRTNFTMQGGIRLGSNITTTQAFDLGFDHIALCLGAGKPRFMNSTDYFTKGVKSASDFLMNLQQGASYLTSSNSNLLLRMPAIVIGCGLTAIDSAVEILHYYPIQVENFYNNWQNKTNPNQDLNVEEQEIAQEFIAHAKLFRSAKNDIEKLQILQELGGVTICYRKTLQESPAYRLNHEEIEHALAIGVKLEESLSPDKLNQDQHGWVQSVVFSNNKIIKAKSILLAIGTEANEFQDIDNLSNYPSDIFKNQDHKISYFGDCNQKYAGNVVKALASAKNGYKAITEALKSMPANKLKLDVQFKSHVHAVNILSKNIVELIIHSPFCVQNFQPGQFFRLQNNVHDIEKIVEPLALTGAYIDKEANLISLIILEIGKSSRLCRTLKAGDEVVLMGPTGAPTEIVQNKKVVLIGGGLGNAVLLPIAEALKANNCQVTYFAAYRKLVDRFYPERIEQYSDHVVWSCEQELISTSREQDFVIKGNIIDSIIHAKQLGILDGAEHIICIGSDRMMAAVAKQKLTLFGNIKMICSINSPMQCMMKGICGQCIQKVTDSREYIFSCSCQDQDSDIIDFDILKKRLQQNSLSEKFN